jgi:hypothetical protein
VCNAQFEPALHGRDRDVAPVDPGFRPRRFAREQRGARLVPDRVDSVGRAAVRGDPPDPLDPHRLAPPGPADVDGADEPATTADAAKAADDEPDEFAELSRSDLYGKAKEADAERADWNMSREEMIAVIRGE